MKRSLNQSHKGEVNFEGEFANIVFQRVLPHPSAVVWNAITNPDEMKHWLMCSTAKIDARAGGQLELVSGPAQFHVTGRVLAWTPPELFEHEWKVAPVGPMPKGESAVFRYELVGRTASTLLTVTYRHLTKGTALGFAPGTHVLLDRLEAQIDGKALPEWLPRFAEVRNFYPGWEK